MIFISLLLWLQHFAGHIVVENDHAEYIYTGLPPEVNFSIIIIIIVLGDFLHYSGTSHWRGKWIHF